MADELEIDPEEAQECMKNFFDYQDCIKAKGKDSESCQPFLEGYQSLCPAEWVEKLNKKLESADSKPKLKTAQFDARFPNTNQTKNCWQNYVDYHKCTKVKGEDYEPCSYFLRTYKSLCPVAWVEKWDDQIESGTFPGRI